MADPTKSTLEPAEHPIDDDVSQRATLVAAELATLAPMSGRIKTAQVLNLVFGGLGVGISVPWLIVANPRERKMAAGFVASSAALLGGGVASYAVPRDYVANTIMVGNDLSLGAVYMTLGLIADDSAAQNATLPAPVGYMIASGFWAQGALRLVDVALRRPISYETLALHYQRLRDPRRRAALTADDLAWVEADFARQAGFISPFLIHAPIMTAGASGLVYSLAAHDLSSAARGWGGGLSGLALILGVAMAAEEQSIGWRLYENQLNQTGLSVSISATPGGGISLDGRF